MAKQISLREFQQGLAQRLREAQTEAEPTSRLGVLAGSTNWLLKLDDAGEMLPLPEFSGVPLTKTWYLGLANIRGVLARPRYQALDRKSTRLNSSHITTTYAVICLKKKRPRYTLSDM